ncbi:MAG: DEAD/DEAH box helicase, partial [Planctomycetota bacterium]
MSSTSRDDTLLQYLGQLPFEPYPVQEEALMAYFDREDAGGGVLACAPTGTGKTVIGEAALYEALVNGTTAYYTTPLIALTEQKFAELQDAAERWGFAREQIGLVTGNRSVNPKANVLVVVAEILLNRLLHPAAFDFTHVSAVVMDEFHSFAEPERGVVWELSLSLLPGHVRLLLLSATVGNASLFLSWLRQQHGRDLTLVQGTERRVPLEYHWVGDQLLPDHLADMVRGDDATRRTPALVFCFDRAKCWATADLLRGQDMLVEGQQEQLAERIDALSENGFFSHGAGPKLKRILMRGVGVHHAGLLPKFRRVVEELFQEKLLSFCVCTETLAAGMNLPARSVVLTELLKGPKGKKKLIAASNAHQMFGRAGRPQFDTQGHVYAIAHEDDVKILRHKEKIAQIPEDTKDPKLMAARK